VYVTIHVTKTLLAHVHNIRKHTSVSEVSSLPVRDHFQTKLYPVNKFTNTSVSTGSRKASRSKRPLTLHRKETSQSAGSDGLTFMHFAVEHRQKRRRNYAGFQTAERCIPTVVLLRHSDLGFNTTVSTVQLSLTKPKTLEPTV